MTGRKNWTRDELSLALNLYCKLPFGKMHSRNPDIIAMANYIGRTPGAVAMKLVNFASLDPTLKQKGLASCSNLDREVWKDFFTDSSVVIRTEEISCSILPMEKDSAQSYFEEDFVASVKTRRMQSFFRRSVLANYGCKCCITGISIPELLVASHIVPWKVDKNNRLNPHNGLCLNALHDKAFDRGFITIGEDMKIIISSFVPRKKVHSLLLDYEGCTILKPEKFCPIDDFLKYHREHIFKN